MSARRFGRVCSFEVVLFFQNLVENVADRHGMCGIGAYIDPAKVNLSLQNLVENVAGIRGFGTGFAIGQNFENPAEAILFFPQFIGAMHMIKYDSTPIHIYSTIATALIQT
jgi:hypothetical protein